MFAVTVGPPAGDAPWDLLNTVVAVLVGVIAFCVICPHGEVGPFDPWWAVPKGIVIGLIIGIGAAWPVQLVTGSDTGGSNGGPVIGLVAGVVFFGLSRRRTRRLTRRPTATSDAGRRTGTC